LAIIVSAAQKETEIAAVFRFGNFPDVIPTPCKTGVYLIFVRKFFQVAPALLKAREPVGPFQPV